MTWNNIKTSFIKRADEVLEANAGILQERVNFSGLWEDVLRKLYYKETKKFKVVKKKNKNYIRRI